MKQLYLSISLLLLVGAAWSQPAANEPDISRALFHYKIDKTQKDLLASDGTADELLSVYGDAETNLQLTYQLTTRVDQLQKDIEQDTRTDAGQKIGYLRGLNDLLVGFGTEVAKKKFSWNVFPSLLGAFEDAVNRQNLGQSLVPVLQPLPFDQADMLAANFAFSTNVRIQEVREYLLLKYLQENPSQTLPRIARHADYSYTDSLISVCARKRPEELITYAQARNTPLGQKILASKDPLVQMVSQLAGDNRGQLYLPFLDQLSRGTLTRQEIGDALRDSSKYYSLLVVTEIDYAQRMQKGDTPVTRRALNDMLRRKSLETYVNTINGLHDSPNNIRFRCIQRLNTEELYYLIVMNESEIYTSSYMYVYQQLFERMPSKSADSLLHRVAYDKYKKFLTMSANYNTLDDFLSKMSKDHATALMTDFVNNLEGSADKDDIEDAVDVANAYASINNMEIKRLMLSQVSANLDHAVVTNNHKGMVVYRLEKVIMQSNMADLDSSVAAVDMAGTLGIPPVYEIRNGQLRDTSGRIVLQMFFYGDASGKGTFNHFLRLYGDRSRWAMKSTPYWVEFSSIGTPVPIVLYANRALDEENDEDEEAQLKLIEHLNKNGIVPSITVHRGHSYYLKYTIEKMLPSKVVVLGSCGAYHNLSDILKISPDAYIISSKQVGYGEINVALFTYLVDRLKMGLDVKWPTMMQEVATRISAGKREGYDDYIFPHQNLGALFIKAYKIANSEEGSMP